MSLAGAQHKLPIVKGDERLYEPLGSTPSTHILKPDHPSPDFPQSVMNEWFVMRRFDRIGAERNVRRLHSIDACQLLGLDAAYKYQQGSVERLAEIVSLCRNKVVARLRLYQWLIFNTVVGNTDAHLKNLSFTVGPQGVELAPFYDLLSTGVYETPAFDGRGWPQLATMAWPILNTRTVADIKRQTLLDAAIVMGIAKATATRQLDLLLKQINRKGAVIGAGAPDMTRLAENRCVRSIVHSVIMPTLTGLLATPVT